jgi:protocatechuate 3,4-dioxygenase, beta subunit
MSQVRRRIVLAFGAAAVAPLWPTPVLAQAREPTPRMTEGPFYPRSFPHDTDGDLTRLAGSATIAQGEVLDVEGLILERSGKPRAGARLEVWQCDVTGHYHHVGGGEGDPAFQGFGAVTTDAEGRYRFRTIKPVPYPGRTPHIHFAVLEGGRRRLVSQMFIEGEPGNSRDGLYRYLGEEARRVTMRLQDARSAGAKLHGSLDIVI